LTIAGFDAALLHEILSMQRTLRERRHPSAAWTARARAYAQELYVQFGLARPDAPDVTTNPEFRPYFG
jgi:hypothetical protein